MSKIVNTKDFWFSFLRGSFNENLKMTSAYWCKKIFFKVSSLIFRFQKKQQLEIRSIARIGVYLPTSAGMGDLIMASLFFQELRRYFKQAEIILFSKYPHVLDKSFVNRVVNLSSDGVSQQVKKINAEELDLLCFPEKSVQGTRVFIKANSRYKLGYLSSYHVVSNFNERQAEFVPHKHHYYLKSFLLLCYLFNNRIDYPDYNLDLSHWECSHTLTSQPYVVLVPKVLWENRSLSFQSLLSIIDVLLRSPYQIFMTGGGESLVVIQKLVKHYQSNRERFIYQEKLSLDEFAAVIKQSDGVICGDSGPMHLAFGFQKPVLSFWGPTFPELRLPVKSPKGSRAVFEKEKCPVANCYNMEHKPFCKTCLRLENIPRITEYVEEFVKNISDIHKR